MGASRHSYIPGMPIMKKMTLHKKVESHTDLLTLTEGFFSFTHDGTVVTKPG